MGRMRRCVTLHKWSIQPAKAERILEGKRAGWLGVQYLHDCVAAEAQFGGYLTDALALLT
jgi:hypothetical protein